MYARKAKVKLERRMAGVYDYIMAFGFEFLHA